ncbi:MAG TPA: dTDP-4-dehydrorhamnose 3,5-epimerase family protein, partial [Candidatus Nitrosotalea sp.]|nr:dTDP-4-dehydrorhamnose 3,5-epimerase family protein [Candidatus Nitrosotalea sp.]
VIIDLRPRSKTFKNWIGVELNEKNYKMLYVPEGFAHGFITLQNNTEVFYHMSETYMSKHASGVLWNDSAFNIKWPLKPGVISERDLSFLPFSEKNDNK